MSWYKVVFRGGASLKISADDAPEAAAIACRKFARRVEDVKEVVWNGFVGETENPLAMSWDRRMDWYDGVGAVMGLTALLIWMHTPPLCQRCACNDAVDRIDAYEIERDDRGGWIWNVREGLAWCEVCIDDDESKVVPHGSEPHLIPAERVAMEIGW